MASMTVFGVGAAQTTQGSMVTADTISGRMGKGTGRVNRGERAGIGLKLGETVGLDPRVIAFLAD